jgi:hypothetical protein
LPAKKEKNMKTNLLIAAVALGLLTPAIAQFKALGNDGIVASPKYREILDARNASARAANLVVTVDLAGPAVFASPKFLDTMGTRTVIAATPITVKPALKNCCVATKVAASPKALDNAPPVAGGCCPMNSCMIACAR